MKKKEMNKLEGQHKKQVERLTNIQLNYKKLIEVSEI